MSLAVLHEIEHEFRKLTLLRGANLTLYAGERAALVGPNGSGKTTIFRILSKQIAPTAGQVIWGRALRVGYLPQHPQLDTEQTVLELARQPMGHIKRLEARMAELTAEMAAATGQAQDRAMREYARLEARHATGGGFSWAHRVEEVLAGVGFGPDEYDKPAGVLSGGQQGRLALAQLLLTEPDLMLLDEPTNHLDFEGTVWLEKYLLRVRSSVLLVSHDRYLLDRVVTRVHELVDGRIESYRGNYSDFVQQRAHRLLERQRQYEKDQAFIAKERDFIARFKVGQRSKEARGRETRLERQLAAGELLTESVQDRRTLKLRLATDRRGSEQALRVHEVSKRYGEQVVLRDVTFDLRGGQKLAIIGPNGSGKTTLLRIATGQEAPDSGTVRVGSGMTVGYYDQKQAGLDDSLTVFEQMRRYMGGGTEGEVRTFLARFMFSGDEAFKAVASLSGGERSRLLLARLLYERPNFLILDEPTNHLDIPSCEMLEQALSEYDGTVLLVSHDRYFVDRVCNRTLLLWPGRYEMIEGNYSFWRQREEDRAAEAARAQAAAETTAAAAPPRPRQAPPRPGSAPSGLKVGGLNSYQLAKLSADMVEQQVHQAEQRLREIEQSFASPEVYGRADRFEQAHREHAELQEQIEGLMQLWEFKMQEE